jgi:hypothetical protein
MSYTADIGCDSIGSGQLTFLVGTLKGTGERATEEEIQRRFRRGVKDYARTLAANAMVSRATGIARNQSDIGSSIYRVATGELCSRRWSWQSS